MILRPSMGAARRLTLTGSERRLLDLGAGRLLGVVERLGLEERRTRSHTGPADLLADRAVAMMLSVAGALLRAVAAGANARFQQAVDEEQVRVGGPREHAGRDVARVRAVQA